MSTDLTTREQLPAPLFAPTPKAAQDSIAPSKAKKK